MSERLRHRRKRLRNYYAVAGIIIFLILGFIFLRVTYREELRVSTISTSGNYNVATSDITAIAEKAMTPKSFLIFPGNSIIFLPEGRIKNAIYDKYPRIKNISVKRDGLHSILISVDERQEVGQWCGISPDEASICFLFDKDGYVFSVAPHTTPLSRWFSPLEKESDPMLNTVFDEGAVSHVLDLSQSLKSSGIDVDSFVLRKPDEVDLMLSTGARVTYILGQEDSMAVSIPKVIKQEAPSIEFDYLDMRFGRKVYLKRNESVE